MTTTLHLENTVRDFDSWKATFDKFDRFRADKNVRSYRISRLAGSPEKVVVDLEFDSQDDAAEFARALEKVRATPQSKDQLVDYKAPVLLTVVAERVIAAAS
ncbi:hypothetical protein [Antrihabitans sp. YC2-6]|uniref:hypothetical protein n=1 Tax=Antrihabitans sp. YC2-6 TaxID=2799498 RepID=UPI0018F5833B|nr:hypothetical protein [Antrihabitans sp. YC2-6]MBJ8348526.1 hypothetical protein [Antrihabitans sp. YC2-6]